MSVWVDINSEKSVRLGSNFPKVLVLLDIEIYLGQKLETLNDFGRAWSSNATSFLDHVLPYNNLWFVFDC